MELSYNSAVNAQGWTSNNVVNQRVCTPALPVTYDCNSALGDLSTTFNPSAEPDLALPPRNFPMNVANVALTPSNTVARWINNTLPDFCPVSCYAVETAGGANVSWITASTLGSQSLSVDRSVTRPPIEVQISCSFVNGTDVYTRKSHKFTVGVCSPAVMGTSPTITYVPVAGDVTTTSTPGPTLSYTGTACPLDTCTMLSSPTCELAGGAVTGLTCSLTDDGSGSITTTVGYQAGLVYGAVYMRLHKSGRPGRLCSAQIPLVFDCSTYL